MNMSTDESIQAMKKIVAISIAGAAAALVATWRKVRAESSPAGEWFPAESAPSRSEEAATASAAPRDSGAAQSSPATRGGAAAQDRPAETHGATSESPPAARDTEATQGSSAAGTPSTPAEESTPSDESADAGGGLLQGAGSASDISAESSTAELYEVAQRLGIEGRSKMNKQQLLEAIRATD